MVMRILFCNKYNFPFSGTEVYLFELMAVLRSRGHEVALFSMEDSRGEPTPYDQYFVPHVDFKNADAGPLTRTRLAAHALYSTEARRRLRSMIAAFQPDMAHVRNIYHHLSPSVLWELKAQGVPILYHLNDFKVLCPTYNLVSNGQACERPCTGRFWKVFTERCYAGSPATAFVLVAEAYLHYGLDTYRRCVDHFLTPSQFAKDLLAKNGFGPEKITVLPHFQNLPNEVPPPAADAPVLYFGRLSREKGVADLIQAMRPLPHIRLQIAGDGPERTELEDLARQLQLRNVEFLGHLGAKDLERFITAAQFTVLPSRAYETLGKSILESYAWGRPVVASDLGSRRELVRDGETGLLYPPGDIEQLASAMARLANAPHRAAEMGAAGRRFVQSRHSVEGHYQNLMRLYQQMISLQRPRKLICVPRAPRVAFIGGRGVISRYSGIEAYYEEVGKRLAEMGYEITIYCRSYFTPPLTSYNGMRLVRIPTLRSKHFETVIHTLLSTIHVMFSTNEIVHYHAQGPALFSFLPRLVGKKTVVTVQGLDWQRKKWGGLASLTLRLGEWASARFPNATMVVSRSLQNHYRLRFGAATRYIPNGTILRERSLSPEIRRWGLAPDNYVLFLGRFSPEKNCHLLAEAYKKLETSAKLVFAGGSSHTDQYANALRQHQSEQITFLDWVSGDAFNALLTNAALFVLPSDLEGLSLALLEAMGAGICVLTSDIPENHEVVEDAGFTFRAGDVDDFARMMELLLSDPEVRAMAGRSAKQRIEHHYLWPQITTEIAATYDELAARRGARKPPVPEKLSIAGKAESEEVA